jgi:methionyl-tRNA formyltransferase
MKDLRIIFMGTPEFAVATLGALLMNGYNVVGVVTTPDKPAGRGRKITKPAVKEFAEKSCLPVLQPGNLTDPLFIEELKSLKADYIIVVAFRKLPEAVWSLPSGGTINLHASLLPHYRGAAPINRVIMNGETKTGVTTFFINDRIDTGNILLREQVNIYRHENAGDLHDRLKRAGARLVIKTLKGLSENKITPISQSELLGPGEVTKSAPKIFPEDCLVDWNKSIAEVNNLVRGLSPYPCARSFLRTGSEIVSFKIYESRIEKAKNPPAPGTVISDGSTFLRIACNNGYLQILSLQLEGRKRLGIEEFLRGFDPAGCTAIQQA